MTVHFARTSRAIAASALTLVLATASLPALAASEKALTEAPAASGGRSNQNMAQLATSTITASTVYLPVDYVYDQLAAARIALSAAEPDVATAKRAVENAERSLVTVVTTVEDDRKS